MIQELIARANQYYIGFTNLPIEGQVIGGVGLLVVVAALKNVWGILYPVRWTAASLLRIAAFLMHPRKRKPKTDPGGRKGVFDDGGTSTIFDASSKERFIATVKSYKGKLARDLSNEQINLLIKAGDIYQYQTVRHYNGGLGLMKHIVTEQERRLAEAKVAERAAKAAALQNQVAEVEPEKVPFVASEADVA